MADLDYNLRRKYNRIDTIHENPNTNVKFWIGKDEVLCRLVGIKEFPLENNKENQVRNEIITNINFSRITPYIPQVYEYFVDYKNKKIYIVSEYVGEKNLRTAINNNEINEKKAFDIIEKLIYILNSIQKKFNHINHRDLKPENILLDKSGNVYLIDFGLTAIPLIYGEGTNGYKAPEQSNGKSADGFLKVDQYALGIMFCELLLGSLPTNGIDFLNGNSEMREQFPLVQNLKAKGYTNNFVNFIFKLINNNPSDRYRNMEDVLFQLKGFKKNNYGKAKR